MEQYSGYSEIEDILASTAGNPVLWGKFFERLTELAECDSGYILVTDLMHREKTHFLFSHNISQQQQDLYVSKFNTLDIFNYLLSQSPRQVFCSQLAHYTAISEDIDVDDSGFQYRCGFAIPCNSHHSLNLCVNRRGAFSEQDLQYICELLLAIVTPLEDAIRADLQQKIYSQILPYTHNHIDSYVIIDQALNILFSDSTCIAIIDKFHCISISGQHIMFNNHDVQQHLTLLMSNNESASVHNVCDTCMITLVPVTSLDNLYDWECFKEGFILVFTHDTQKNPMIERLINIHKLSRCEALCALDFMQTSSIVDIATNNCRSENTVRNHIKRVMHKMGVHNQAALMKKLISLAAL
ncbi:MAG: hypothetical protein methR_P3327 [Methyloprofundus sp.]|nr:MAG: hypothetical protein methR_P3327 [Methyloprofundus sp.]